MGTLAETGDTANKRLSAQPSDKGDGHGTAKGASSSHAARLSELTAGVSQLSLSDGGGNKSLGNDDEYDLLEHAPAAKVLSIGPNEVLLRGSSVRNTAWAYVLVFNTGHDTKLVRD